MQASSGLSLGSQLAGLAYVECSNALHLSSTQGDGWSTSAQLDTAILLQFLDFYVYVSWLVTT